MALNLARPVDYRQQSVDFSPLANIGLAYAGQQQRQQQQEQQQQLVSQAQEIAGTGDVNAMRDFAIANPVLGKTMFEFGGIADEQAQNRMSNLTKSLVSSATPVQDLKTYIEQGRQAGRDMTHSEKLLQQSGGDPEKLKQMTEMSLAVQDPKASKALQNLNPKVNKGVSAPGSVRETEWFMEQTPEVQEQHLKLKRKTDPTMAEKLEAEQAKSDIKVSQAGREAGAKGAATRQQGFIDAGVDAVDGLGNAIKVRDLLNTVETGGYDAAALRAKQLFGIESADEAQLSAGLGKAILSQLKPIFGAAFTAAEGDRLEKIEANFGKSTEGNKRLIDEIIKTTEKAAKRGIRAAKSQGDQFSVDEIQSALDTLKGSEGAAGNEGQQTYSEGTVIRNPSTGATMTMRNGEWVNG